MTNYSIVVGVKSSKLSRQEKEYLKKYRPLGVILFKRNILNKKQVSFLVKEIKNILGLNALIMIDQEGGKVSRLCNKIWPSFPAANFFGRMAEINLETAKRKTFDNYYLIGKILSEIGVNINCAPVLDLSIKRSDKVIGSRSFSSDPKIVGILGNQACRGLLAANVNPVIKHIPGHGRAKDDSHKKLPTIELNKNELNKDFYPFKILKKVNFAMTAHIKYQKLDFSNCATHSKFIINNVIRKEIGFEGILFSDDLCMKALNGPYFLRAKNAIDAGCDIVLHCEPNLKYIVKSTLGAGKASTQLKKRLFK